MKHLIWVLVGLSFVGTGLVYPYLPEEIPVHWNIKGIADEYSPKQIVFLMTVVPVFMYYMLMWLPKIDPKKDYTITHDKAFARITYAIILSMVSFYWLGLMASLEIVDDVAFYVRMIVGALFVLIGLYIGKIEMNHFAGIRLPWTITNKRVWKKTHMVAGGGFIGVGVVSMMTAVYNAHLSFYYFISLFVLVILITVSYSLLLHLQESRS